MAMPCSFFQKGHCHFGSRCRNLHTAPATAATEPQGADSSSLPPSSSSLPPSSMSTTTPTSAKRKRKLRPSQDVVSRLLWDSTVIDVAHVTVGYLDRFTGLQEEAFEVFNWHDDLVDAECHELVIPRHRIQFFRYRGYLLWDRRTRIDHVFDAERLPAFVAACDAELAAAEALAAEEARAAETLADDATETATDAAAATVTEPTAATVTDTTAAAVAETSTAAETETLATAVTEALAAAVTETATESRSETAPATQLASAAQMAAKSDAGKADGRLATPPLLAPVGATHALALRTSPPTNDVLGQATAQLLRGAAAENVDMDRCCTAPATDLPLLYLTLRDAEEEQAAAQALCSLRATLPFLLRSTQRLTFAPQVVTANGTACVVLQRRHVFQLRPLINALASALSAVGVTVTAQADPTTASPAVPLLVGLSPQGSSHLSGYRLALLAGIFVPALVLTLDRRMLDGVLVRVTAVPIAKAALSPGVVQAGLADRVPLPPVVKLPGQGLLVITNDLFTPAHASPGPSCSTDSSCVPAPAADAAPLASANRDARVGLRSPVDCAPSATVPLRPLFIVLRGISGAGKSSFSRGLAQQVAARGGSPPFICSADFFFETIADAQGTTYENVFDTRLLNEAHKWCTETFEAALAACEPCILLDNTNMRHSNYERYVVAAQAAGYNVAIVELQVVGIDHIAYCASRNTHGVPFSTLQHMIARFQADRRAIVVDTWPFAGAGAGWEEQAEDQRQASGGDSGEDGVEEDGDVEVQGDEGAASDKNSHVGAKDADGIQNAASDASDTTSNARVAGTSSDSADTATPIRYNFNFGSEPAYAGLFLTPEAIDLAAAAYPARHSQVRLHHVTLAFEPSAAAVALLPIGSTVRVRVRSEAADAYCQALAVALSDADGGLLHAVCRNRRPHITVSAAPDVESVYSNTLLAQHDTSANGDTSAAAAAAAAAAGRGSARTGPSASAGAAGAGAGEQELELACVVGLAIGQTTILQRSEVMLRIGGRALGRGAATPPTACALVILALSDLSMAQTAHSGTTVLVCLQNSQKPALVAAERLARAFGLRVDNVIAASELRGRLGSAAGAHLQVSPAAKAQWPEQLVHYDAFAAAGEEEGEGEGEGEMKPKPAAEREAATKTAPKAEATSISVVARYMQGWGLDARKRASEHTVREVQCQVTAACPGLFNNPAVKISLHDVGVLNQPLVAVVTAHYATPTRESPQALLSAFQDGVVGNIPGSLAFLDDVASPACLRLLLPLANGSLCPLQVFYAGLAADQSQAEPTQVLHADMQSGNVRMASALDCIAHAHAITRRTPAAWAYCGALLQTQGVTDDILSLCYKLVAAFDGLDTADEDAVLLAAVNRCVAAGRLTTVVSRRVEQKTQDGLAAALLSGLDTDSIEVSVKLTQALWPPVSVTPFAAGHYFQQCVRLLGAGHGARLLPPRSSTGEVAVLRLANQGDADSVASRLDECANLIRMCATPLRVRVLVNQKPLPTQPPVALVWTDERCVEAVCAVAAGTETRHALPASLSPRQRRLVHEQAAAVGVTSVSQGTGKDRHVVLTRK